MVNGRSHMKWNGSHKPALTITKAYVFISNFHVENIRTFVVCNRLNGTNDYGDEKCGGLADENVTSSYI